MLLKRIDSVKDFKKLKEEQMEQLAREIRSFLIEGVSRTGGHLASNLGVVELTMALHRIFDTEKDKLIFDVGHQSYVHKILTGRKADFQSLRQLDGLCGFPKRSESTHDCFGTGHSSTSISAGLGMALARDLKGEDHEVVCVIGDGALTGGLAFEALNHLGSTKTNMLVVLNDNEMSICPNVGGLSNYLCKIRMGETYRSTVRKVVDTVGSIPFIGKKTVDTAIKWKNKMKHIFIPGAYFDEMGVKYFGPVDGHDYKTLVSVLKELKKIQGPKILHVLTAKGKGYGYAEENPSAYHGVGPFDKHLGVAQSKALTYSDAVGAELNELFRGEEKTVVITAAMVKGTGLDILVKNHPKKVVDVGIAESHAVTLAAGFASAGIKPYFAVYSTFLQRGYDQIVHDVCIQKLPVKFLIDRAGIVGEDGETHQGLLDLSYLIPIPNMTILAPKDRNELLRMIRFSHNFSGPIAIRYPRGKAVDLSFVSEEEDLLKWEVISEGDDGSVLACGKMVETALKTCAMLREKGIRLQIINARCIKPLDERMLSHLCRRSERIYTIEDNFINGGFGNFVSKFLLERGYQGRVVSFGFPDRFIEHGKVEALYERYGLSEEALAQRIYQDMKKEDEAEAEI